jgi:serine/threonine protein kinase
MDSGDDDSLADSFLRGLARTRELKPLAGRGESLGGGRYRVVRILGEGGQKVVFHVEDTELHRQCALSLIKTGELDDRALDVLRREAQAMARLGRNPNLVTVFDIGEESGRPFIVCELVEGGDLRQTMKRSPNGLPLDQALSIARDLARALSQVHSVGMVHRDVKPGNVWLASDGTAKLGDFGLVLATGRSGAGAEGTIVGTTAYMSPEQAEGKNVDRRSDLYGLGCVFFELLTGTPPFAEGDERSLSSPHRFDQPKPPSAYRSDVSRDVDALVLRLLATSRDDRPADAVEVLVQLERIQFQRERVTSARYRSLAFASVMGVLSAAVSIASLMKTTSPFLDETIAGLRIIEWTLLAAVGGIAYEMFMWRLLRGRESVPRLFPYLTTIVEMMLPTSLILIFSAGMDSTHAINSPPLLVYTLLIILSALHLSAAVCLFAGFLAALNYLTLYLLLIAPYRGPEVGTFLTEPWPHFMRGLALAVTGVAAAFVTRAIKKTLLKSFVMQLDTQRMLELLRG